MARRLGPDDAPEKPAGADTTSTWARLDDEDKRHAAFAARWGGRISAGP
jgi:hypothetical protein